MPNKDVIDQNKEHKNSQNPDLEHPVLSISSITNKSNTSKHKSKTVYIELLDRLKKDFYTRWDKKTVSTNKGLDDFIPVKTLGTGSFGRVLLVKRKENDVDVYHAMKVIDKTRIIKLKQLDHTFYEKKILQAVRFPFIINMEYCFKDNSYIYFVMPFINGGEMFTHLRRMRRFTEILAKFYAAQVVLALEFLHHCDVLYRDLKPENILIDEKGYIKIADLGFCKIVTGRTWTLCGTPEYLAPEIILGKCYGKGVDWWTVGILLYEMLAGYPPFTSADPLNTFEKVLACKYKFPSGFSVEAQDLIKNLVQVDLSRRYGILKDGVWDIKDHQWFKTIDWMAVYNRQLEAPFVPTLKSSGDTSNFDAYKEEKLRVSVNDKYNKDFSDF